MPSWIALRANGHAKDAARDSRKLIAAERRRTFDLEVLRDLVERIEDQVLINDIVARPQALAERLGPTLAMLPEADLPFWHSLKAMTYQELADVLGATPEEKLQLQMRMRYGGGSGQIAVKLRDRLLADLDAAIRARRDASEH